MLALLQTTSCNTRLTSPICPATKFELSNCGPIELRSKYAAKAPIFDGVKAIELNERNFSDYVGGSGSTDFKTGASIQTDGDYWFEKQVGGRLWLQLRRHARLKGSSGPLPSGSPGPVRRLQWLHRPLKEAPRQATLAGDCCTQQQCDDKHPGVPEGGIGAVGFGCHPCAP